MSQLNIAILGVLLSINVTCLAQNENDIVSDSLLDISAKKLHGDYSFSFKTQNYFRGLLPSAAPCFASTIGIIWQDFVFGMYGGVGFDGLWQETDFILIYNKPQFDIHLEYYYNSTQGITDIPTATGLFDFNKQTTRGILDFIGKVRLDKNNQWNLTSAVFLFGRDTDIEETIVGNDTVTMRTTQRYSQYLELEYTWYWKNTKVQAHVGGSFSWANPDGPQFYGKHPGFNNIGISFSRKFIINNNLQLPVKVSPCINTIAETAYLILSVNLIQINKH